MGTFVRGPRLLRETRSDFSAVIEEGGGVREVNWGIRVVNIDRFATWSQHPGRAPSISDSDSSFCLS